MTRLRVGTRGSELALRQTRWVCDRLRPAHGDLTIEEVVIQTRGDMASDGLDGTTGSESATVVPGWFVSAIEEALLEGRIDFAVHSHKDLQSTATDGLVVAAVPTREVAHDVLVTREAVVLDHLPNGFRIGTGSPRRTAQLQQLGGVHILPIRGNVPTRLSKVEGPDYDGVVLAAAGLKRLGITPPHVIDLPTERFVPAPAQGALALQTRQDHDAMSVVAILDDATARCAVEAERAFLRSVNAGCHTPVGALATVDGGSISLHGQLFSDDYVRVVDGFEVGRHPRDVGARLADRLMRELRAGL